MREFMAAAHTLTQYHSPEQEAVHTADNFFDEDEKQKLKDMKIVAARKRKQWQKAALDH